MVVIIALSRRLINDAQMRLNIDFPKVKSSYKIETLTLTLKGSTIFACFL